MPTEENCRFDRYEVSYLTVLKQKITEEFETLADAAEFAKILKENHNMGFPRSKDIEDTELTVCHNIYYGLNNLNCHFHFTSDVIYTCREDDSVLERLAEKADYTPEIGKLYVCGEMDSDTRHFAVVKEIDTENSILTADVYSKIYGERRKLSDVAYLIEKEIDGFKNYYHEADEYAIMKFKKYQECEKKLNMNRDNVKKGNILWS